MRSSTETLIATLRDFAPNATHGPNLTWIGETLIEAAYMLEALSAPPTEGEIEAAAKELIGRIFFNPLSLMVYEDRVRPATRAVFPAFLTARLERIEKGGNNG